MPNRNYLAGRRCERAVVKFYREMGWEACRTAGSHGLIDVVAWAPDGPLHIVQVKRCKRGGSWRDGNWKRLIKRSPQKLDSCCPDLTMMLATPRVYAFVYRHGKRTPEIYDAQGAREWAA